VRGPGGSPGPPNTTKATAPTTTASAPSAMTRAAVELERATLSANLVGAPLSRDRPAYGGYPYRSAHTMAVWMAPPTSIPTGSAPRVA
jgi:hypothetical protein